MSARLTVILIAATMLADQLTKAAALADLSYSPVLGQILG